MTRVRRRDSRETEEVQKNLFCVESRQRKRPPPPLTGEGKEAYEAAGGRGGGGVSSVWREVNDRKIVGKGIREGSAWDIASFCLYTLAREGSTGR